MRIGIEPLAQKILCCVRYRAFFCCLGSELGRVAAQAVKLEAEKKSKKCAENEFPFECC